VRVPHWLDLRAVVSYLLPALAAAGFLATLPAGVGPPLAALAAVLLALVLSARAAARVEKLRQWVVRIGRGERARAPLPSGVPDVLDALSAELSS